MVKARRLQLRRGDTGVIPFQAITVESQPIDLTGSTVRFAAKQSLADSDADALISKVSPTGIILNSDPTTGIGEVIVDPEDTEGLLAVVYNLTYNIQVTSPSGQVTTVQEGPLIIVPDATITHP